MKSKSFYFDKSSFNDSTNLEIQEISFNNEIQNKMVAYLTKREKILRRAKELLLNEISRIQLEELTLRRHIQKSNMYKSKQFIDKHE